MDNRNGTPEKFWVKVRKTRTCWIWTGDKDRKGYGRVRRRALAYRTVQAHRYAWIITNGRIFGGMHVLHKCDTPACVRPSHLWLGTHQDNMDDMWHKGRGNPGHVFGSKQGSAKLTDGKVRNIRAMAARGFKQQAIADAFGIDRSNVSIIVLRKGWRHVV